MTRIDFVAINQVARLRLGDLLAQLLPDGRLRGKEWVARNPTRNDRKAGSFSINVETGQWSDFATGDKGGDVVSLIAYLTHSSQLEAAEKLCNLMGVQHV